MACVLSKISDWPVQPCSLITLLDALRIAMDPLLLHAGSEDSDQIAWMDTQAD